MHDLGFAMSSNPGPGGRGYDGWMRGKGITYDTGFINAGEHPRTLRPDIVKREMRIIRDDLHCNAVRITGGDPDRLEIAAPHAAEAGLEVWFSPFTCDLTTDELLALLADCAERAERLAGREPRSSSSPARN